MAKQTGFILIDKPEGPTSHDMVTELRRITGIKKIGHAGTLDPFAIGLLIMAVGREATKRMDRFVKLDKEYIADIQLGAKTDTHDRTGTLVNVDFNYSLSENKIKRTLFDFVGEVEQLPPMYSAKKMGGVKLYELARQGVEVERRKVRVKIRDIDLIQYENQSLKIVVKCGSGTYIRTLAHDIGQKLGCGGYLKELRRTAIGKYKVENAASLDILTADNWGTYLF